MARVITPAILRGRSAARRNPSCPLSASIEDLVIAQAGKAHEHDPGCFQEVIRHLL